MAVGHVPCGIAIPQSFANVPVDVTLIKGFVSTAETLGYDSLWVQEQIISDISILEPVTLLTYAAAVTAKLRLGTSVLVPVIANLVWSAHRDRAQARRSPWRRLDGSRVVVLRGLRSARRAAAALLE